MFGKDLIDAKALSIVSEHMENMSRYDLLYKAALELFQVEDPKELPKQKQEEFFLYIEDRINNNKRKAAGT